MPAVQFTWHFWARITIRWKGFRQGCSVKEDRSPGSNTNQHPRIQMNFSCLNGTEEKGSFINSSSENSDTESAPSCFCLVCQKLHQNGYNAWCPVYKAPLSSHHNKVQWTQWKTILLQRVWIQFVRHSISSKMVLRQNAYNACGPVYRALLSLRQLRVWNWSLEKIPQESKWNKSHSCFSID